MTTIRLIQGESPGALCVLDDNSVDSIVTDPPYGLSFMGKKWDYDVPSVDVWRECLRVLKPGGYLLAFAGTRTQHRMAVRIEDAGFEIRDMIAWIYGSGFPKSLDVSKAIDKAAGAVREVVGPSARHVSGKPNQRTDGLNGSSTFAESVGMGATITAPATDLARQWQGWGTALKPALEPITVARKPLIGTVAANVTTWGTGAINVDGGRVPGEKPDTTRGASTKASSMNSPIAAQGRIVDDGLGRFPANLIHDGSDEVVGLFPVTGAGQAGGVKDPNGAFGYHGGADGMRVAGVKDAPGSAARYFYCAKASRHDRESGCDHLEAKTAGEVTGGREEGSAGLDSPRAGAGRGTGSRNHHPTVKPTELMRYLCRLVTQPGGVILDPFMGSGSTGRGAVLEGFQFIGVERESDYIEIARARIAAVTPEEPQEDAPPVPGQIPLF
jgi:hypothetical protein